MASSSIPIATYGRHESISHAVAKGMRPEYDAVHQWIDLAAAKREIPLLIRGDLSPTPDPGMGTNRDRPVAERRAPRAVLVGGGIPEDEYQDLRQAVREALAASGDEENVLWFRITIDDVAKHIPPGAPRPEGPVPEYIVKTYKEMMDGKF